MTHPTLKRISLNYRRNIEQDNGDKLYDLANVFDYEADKGRFWNPEEFSLLWGTPLWHESDHAQRLVLNHLFWVAYYSQIISAEIATILLNQTSAASLFTVREFHEVCRMLDHESFQERAHINAFAVVARKTEEAIFGETIFSKDLKLPYTEPMLYQNTNLLRRLVKQSLLKYFALLSSGHVFLGCQYFTVRGLRTLKGKMIQHKLSQYTAHYGGPEESPVPSQISYYHFLDESYHFNSSKIIALEIPHLIPKPTHFERLIINQGVLACQRDHFYFNSVVAGIFWYEPALYPDVYRLLRSPIWGFNHVEALNMMESCFTKENDGVHRSYQLHKEATKSYEMFVNDLAFLTPTTKEMRIMKGSSLESHFQRNQKNLAAFAQKKQA